MRRRNHLCKALTVPSYVCLAGAFLALFAGNALAIGSFLTATVSMAGLAVRLERQREDTRKKGTG